MLPRQLADGLEIAGLGEHDPEVHHRRLHDHAGGLAALLDQELDAPLHRGRVVERHRDRQVGDRLRDAGPVRERLVVVAVADLVVVDADRDHHVVVVAVVGAEDLDDRVAPRDRPRDPDRVHGRLGARVRVPPPGQAPAALQLFGDNDAVLGGRREVRPLRVALGQRLADGRVGVALHHRAEAVVEVEQLVPVDVPDLRPAPAGEVDRPGIAHLVGGGDAGGEGLAGALVHGLRGARPLVEPGLLALGQFLDSLAVDLDDGDLSCHRTSPPRVPLGVDCSAAGSGSGSGSARLGLGLGLELRLGLGGGLPQDAQGIRRQVQRHGRSLLVGQRGAVVRQHHLDQATSQDADAKLAEAPEEDGVLDQTWQPVEAVCSGRLDPHALRADHRLHVAARGDRPLAGAQRPLGDPEVAAIAVLPLGCGRDQVGDAEEVGDEERLRVLVDRLRRACLLDMAVVHDRDAVAHRQRLFLVVRDEDERDADVFLERLQLDLEVLAQARVERAERLVQEQHARAQDERSCERDTLLLAAGQLVRLASLEARRAARARASPRRRASFRPARPCGT